MNTKRRTISITALALLLALACGLFGSASAATNAGAVDDARAKQIALTDAGLSEADIHTDHFVYFQNGKSSYAYKFVFHTDNKHYVYIINAQNGDIMLSQCSGKGVDVSLATQNPPPANTDSSTSTGSTSTGSTSTTSTSYVGTSAALSATLKKAGAASADVYEFEVKLHVKNTVNYYKVEIELFNGTEIKAEVNATSSEFISYYTKTDDANYQPSGIITAESAMSTALTNAGISTTDLRKAESGLDNEHGTWIYEVEFETNSGAKYEYDINASTGAIVKSK